MPRHHGLGEVHLPRELLKDRNPGAAERSERPGGPAQLRGESGPAHVEQPAPGLQDRYEPARRLEAEGRREGLLEERPARHEGIAVGLGEPGAGRRDTVYLGEDQIQRAPADEHRGGVRDVLARRPLVYVPGCVFGYFGDDLGERPRERRDGVALGAPPASDLFGIEQVRVAAGGDGFGGLRRDQAGTLASLGDFGTEVLKEFAQELELAEPVVPWHTDRSRIAEIGGALSLLSGTLGKVSLDIILMAQTEVGEVSEPAEKGRGGSSTLPHKRNPILSVTAAACTRRVQNLSCTLQSAMVGEHERAAGAWHSEWEALSDALALTSGAASAVREATEGLEVHPEKMRENLAATGGLLLAERVTTVAAEHLGRLEAHDLVEAAARRTLVSGRSLREELLADPALAEVLSEEDIDAALDLTGYLGSAGAFVDRALELYHKEAQE